MENPRKRINRDDSKRRNSQVIDLQAYQNRRRKKVKAKRQGPMIHVDNHAYVRWACYILMSATVIFSILGMIAFSWRTEAQIMGIFTATIGLVSGLWLNALRDRRAPRLLLFASGAFVFTYLCALLHFVI